MNWLTNAEVVGMEWWCAGKNLATLTDLYIPFRVPSPEHDVHGRIIRGSNRWNDDQRRRRLGAIDPGGPRRGVLASTCERADPWRPTTHKGR